MSPSANRPVIFVPLMPEEIWEQIREARWEANGWQLNGELHLLQVVEVEGVPTWKLFERRVLLKEEVEGEEDTMRIVYEPPPSNMYNLSYREWVRISAGELQTPSNTIDKHERQFLLLAVTAGLGQQAAVIELRRGRDTDEYRHVIRRRATDHFKGWIEIPDQGPLEKE